ncbi:MAG: DNA mismatch repair endonuclease MutL [Bacilli bacterium]|nr:DNA mismatch repair endonuclease MutL [Bacilli bacterium]
MSKIKVMDEILANKIAAGEVIEKCVSIVKELVENSIDAKSSKIRIDLLNSGVNEIRVTDNGIGMDSDDALLAFQRHATSKLLSDKDLFNINSLGFRGEALPSIASVSEVELKTCQKDVGTRIVIKGGKLIINEKCEARVGTEIIVKKLFYNTPARLKHLSSLYTELANVSEFVNKIALSYPSISFTLTNDGKTLLNTDGRGSLLKVINSIYGIDITKRMVEVSGSDDEYSISGYISLPEVNKSSRNHMITIVNGRIVRNLEINKCINEAYHTYKPDDRYPIVILNIEVDTSLVDVNIHPTKQDIKFSKLEELKELITNIIINALKEKILIPKMEEKSTIPFINKVIAEKEVVEDKKEEIKEEKKYEEVTLDLDYIKEETSTYQEEIVDNKKVPVMYPVGVVRGTYIVCQNEDGMFLIDQHAANERINYEYYYESLTNKTEVVNMLIPINLEFPSNEYLIIKENLDILRDIGFDIEEFGISSFIIRSHPIWLPKGNEELAIKKILELIVEKEKNFDKQRFNDRVAATVACKASIKANDAISIEEMEVLVNKLRQCKNPYTCPHGRPTIIFYSNYELEKLFKRAM